MTKIIVFDIDGTLANCEHRQHHVRQKPKRWDLFNKNIPGDTPHDDIIWLFKMLANGDTTMLIASGRGEENRPETVEWLNQNGVFCTKLYMRPAKDSRPDNIIKAEILEQIRAEHGEPYMVFDDRNQVVDMWRENGVRCLQVAPGAF
jgi:hydroxymethylpyrimidine pyrophosphatase-like HAD family hydrolase